MSVTPPRHKSCILTYILVSKTGFFNPWLFFGAAALAIGSGLETRFTPETSEGSWIGYQILQGAALGIIQAPTLGVQVALAEKKHLIPVGLSLTIFSQYFGSSIMLSISLTIFQNILIPALEDMAGLTSDQVAQYIKAGNAGVRQLTKEIDEAKLPDVLKAYNSAIAGVMVWFLPSLSFSLSFSAGKKLFGYVCSQLIPGI
jgi:hypothetical protein